LRAAANVLVLQQRAGLPVQNTWHWLLRHTSRGDATLRETTNVLLVLQQWPGLPVQDTWHWLLCHPGRGNQSLPEVIGTPYSKIALTVYIYGVREKESILL
jgi:hypothetical protein